MPHPNGEISVNYFQVGSKWKAEIMLPEKTTGTFYWKGAKHNLPSGKTSLNL
jgi:hypothetical protein